MQININILGNVIENILIKFVTLRLCKESKLIVGNIKKSVIILGSSCQKTIFSLSPWFFYLYLDFLTILLSKLLQN